jgi:predicted ATP-dependent endonuclease of OLD family
MDIQGKLHLKFDTVQVSDKFKRREFVVEYSDNPSYPQYIKFELVQDHCSMLDNVKVGQNLEVSFNLRGRKWLEQKNGQEKYFTTLEAWRITGSTDDVKGEVAPKLNMIPDNPDYDIPF